MTAYDTTISADSPSAHWKLGEAAGAATLNDRIGTAHLTVTGGPTLGVAGLLPNGNGADTAMSTPGTAGSYAGRAGAGSGFVGAAGFSVEAWIKPAAVNVVQTFLFKGDGVNSWLWGAEINADGSIELWVQVTAAFTYNTTTSAAGAVVAGRTYHYVGTWDGTQIRVYLNGALVAGPSGSIAMFHNANDDAAGIYVGTQLGPSPQPFGGTIDEPAFYPSALSLAQVQAHYAAAVDNTMKPALPGMFTPQLVQTGWF